MKAAGFFELDRKVKNIKNHCGDKMNKTAARKNEGGIDDLVYIEPENRAI